MMDVKRNQLAVRMEWIPWRSVTNDRIEHDEELAHASDERHLARFAGPDQAFVERSEDGIESAGSDCRHVEHLANRRSSAPDDSFAAQRAAVSRMRATPTNEAICLRLSRPSSGSSASIVKLRTRPTPGTLCNRLSLALQMGL